MSQVKTGNQVFTSPGDIAEAFKNHFANRGQSLAHTHKKIQNRAIRVITKSSYENSSRFLLNSHGWDNLSVRGAKQKANLMYKCIIIISMIGHLFQNYDTIYVRFSPTYTCNHSCYMIYVLFFFLPRILAFFPALWAFYSQIYDHFLTNAHIYELKKEPIYSP